MTDDLIAVTGATGELGGRIAARLAARGVTQRLVVRDAHRAPALAGAEVVVASDLGAGDEMRRALDGVDTLLLVPATEAPDRVARHVAAVDAAVAAGVRRVVYFSVLRAAPDATFTFARDHWATEERIRSSGLAFTLLRMSLYLDFRPRMADASGVIRGPAGDGRLAAVARDDLADVAVAVLLDRGYEGATIDVTGGESRTLEEVAEELSALARRPIAFVDETIEEAYASRAALGAPDWAVDGWVSSYLAIARGELDVVADAVQRIAGRAPTTLAGFVRAHPESVAGSVSGRRGPRAGRRRWRRRGRRARRGGPPAGPGR